jgi:hypothetical protein
MMKKSFILLSAVVMFFVLSCGEWVAEDGIDNDDILGEGPYAPEIFVYTVRVEKDQFVKLPLDRARDYLTIFYFT